MVITQEILNKLTAKPKENPRLRQSMDLRNTPEDNSQRMLNALEPGTIMLIHHHKVDEMFVVLRGRVNVTIHNDDGSIIESIVLCPEEERYGVNIPKGVWHTVEVIEPSVI